MHALHTYVLLMALLCSGALCAQTDSLAKPTENTPLRVATDSLASVDDTTARPTQRNPKRAAIMSALVPGLGQIYNKKYWKLPIVYAGLGTAGFFVGYNRYWWQEYKTAYIRDTNTTDGDVSIYFSQGASLDQLRGAADQHRTWMEYSGLAFAAVYALQIVDAAVDAHLFYFDVSEDLSMRVQPTLQYAQNREPIHGLSLHFTF